ncbi:unnamed protein product [Phytophthora fragariaefolia]|uniref:Unnamed protein product n=1 Tax=Phytophthora fragariaefolia TaxID=1490495 RepID=A0A9W6XAU2_9STRA|nr:unnamed protein product [Phytophthora fragariaefolia]
MPSEGVRRTLRSSDKSSHRRDHGGPAVCDYRLEDVERADRRPQQCQGTETRTMARTRAGGGSTPMSGGTTRSEALPMELEVTTTTAQHVELDQDDILMETGGHLEVDTMGYEGKAQLDREHSEDKWSEFEARFQQRNVMVAFSIDEPTISVPHQGYWGLPELSTGIAQVCESKGIVFESPGLVPTDGRITRLLGC